jgi:hypothetical protein
MYIHFFELWYFNILYKHHKRPNTVGCWWLTPVILAIQEAEIRRIEVPSQLEIVQEILSRKPITKKGR